PAGNWFDLPALAYGRYFRFTFFVQTNAGAVPPQLAFADNPGSFKLPGKKDLPTGKEHFIELRYLRRTPIGSPRLIHVDGPVLPRPRVLQPAAQVEKDGRAGIPLEFPLIPRTGDWPTYPLVEDLVGRKELGPVPQRATEDAKPIRAERLTS